MPRKRAIDQAAEYRKRVFAQYNALPPAPRTIPGALPEPKRRVVYVQAKPRERISRAINALHRHLRDVATERGQLPASFGATDNCVIALPTGEVFFAFTASRQGVLVTERDTDMTPYIEEGAALIREFCERQGRLWGRFSDPTTFASSDGRHVLINRCAVRELTHDD